MSYAVKMIITHLHVKCHDISILSLEKNKFVKQIATSKKLTKMCLSIKYSTDKLFLVVGYAISYFPATAPAGYCFNTCRK
jgi:hypothetical protein